MIACVFIGIGTCRPDGEKKAYVRLLADYDALDVANKVFNNIDLSSVCCGVHFDKIVHKYMKIQFLLVVTELLLRRLLGTDGLVSHSTKRRLKHSSSFEAAENVHCLNIVI